MQVQTEIHLGAVAVDTDWSQVQLPYVAHGHCYHEASNQCTDLSRSS